MSLIQCPECSHKISDKAHSCPKCGVPISGNNINIVEVLNEPSVGVAAILSFFIPGLGQLYKGSLLAGFIWFIAVVLGYIFLIIPGIFFHVLCLIDALTNQKSKPKQEQVMNAINQATSKNVTNTRPQEINSSHTESEECSLKLSDKNTSGQEKTIENKNKISRLNIAAWISAFVAVAFFVYSIKNYESKRSTANMSSITKDKDSKQKQETPVMINSKKIEHDSFFVLEKNNSKEIQIATALKYLKKSVKEIQQVKIKNNTIIILWETIPSDFSLVNRGAAIAANKAIDFGVHVWSVPSTHQGWDESLGYFCETTARRGAVESSSCR